MRERIIHILRCRGATRKLLWSMLENDRPLDAYYDMRPEEISASLKIRPERAQTLYQDLHNSALIEQIEFDKTRCQMITITDGNYPALLKSIQDPPLVLYAAGKLDRLKMLPALSVIGTRNPSAEGLAKTRLLLDPLIKKQWVIVSGMAAGIDGYAHTRTLELGGRTIAVLGSGFSHIYPKHHCQLFHEIVSSHNLVLSEYPPDTPPRKYHFPERNRIISGLAFGTLVIEAMEKSGTLITVDQALDQGRDVFAVPGSPLVPETRGCLQMIGDGAKPVWNADQVMAGWEESGKHLYQV